MSETITLLPNISFYQSTDCTKLIFDFDTIGFPPVDDITDITVTITNSATELLDHSIYGDMISQATGTVDVASNIVTGTTTSFQPEVGEGNLIVFSSRPTLPFRVAVVNTDTELYLTTLCYETISGDDMYVINPRVEIPCTLLGGTTALINGSYSAEVTFHMTTDTTFTYEFSCQCTNYCCVFEQIAKLAGGCDECRTNENVVNAIFAWGLLESAMGAAACGKTSDSNEIMSILDRFCNNKPCNCQ